MAVDYMTGEASHVRLEAEGVLAGDVKRDGKDSIGWLPSRQLMAIQHLPSIRSPTFYLPLGETSRSTPWTVPHQRLASSIRMGSIGASGRAGGPKCTTLRMGRVS